MDAPSQPASDARAAPRGRMTVDEEFADGVYPRPWDSAGLHAAGWSGLVPLLGLDMRTGPKEVGLYTVVREISMPPSFTRHSRQRGNFAPLDHDDVASRWVEGASVIYIGQTSARGGLRHRLRSFSTAAAGHSGGRALWQLEDNAELVVGWMATPPGVIPLLAEAALISRFRRDHQGRVPFGNVLK